MLCDDAGYAALLGGLGGLSHECPECGSDAHGRPYVSKRQISISHPGPGLHLVALSDQPVGVDAEPVGAGIGAGLGIDAVALHRAERAVLGESPDPADLLRVWVAKEAVLKLLGRGLQMAPESFVVRHSDGWYVEPGALNDRGVLVEQLSVEDHVAALATHVSVTRIAQRRT